MAERIGLNLDQHQYRWLRSNCTGEMPIRSIGRATALIGPEGQLTGTHFHPHTIHCFNIPTAANRHYPLGYRIFMPAVILARNQIQKQNGVTPLPGLGTPDFRYSIDERSKAKIIHPFPPLVADASLISPDVPYMETRPCLGTHLRERSYIYYIKAMEGYRGPIDKLLKRIK